MATIGNNASAKIAHVRDSYFDSEEFEYLKELLKDPKEMAIHQKLLKKNVEVLYKKAQALMLAVELGQFDEKQMAKAEYKITHLLAAIEDFEKVLELEHVRGGDKKKEKPLVYKQLIYKEKEEELSL